MNEIQFAAFPQRIISLVPSQTELLCDLGLEERIVGVTKFCVHPAHIRKSVSSIIGGTKNLRLEKIRSLHPDLIIANKEENEQAQVEELSAQFPVWTSDIKTYNDAIQMIRTVGDLTATIEKAEQIISEISEAKNQFTETCNAEFRTLNSLYLIWRNPWMSVGGDTFISDMMDLAGFNNIIKHSPRYPVLTNTELQTLNPELIFLSSEPYPFKEKHIAELNALCPRAKVMLVDGEMFSWYGSRMKKSWSYLYELWKKISPEHHQ